MNTKYIISTLIFFATFGTSYSAEQKVVDKNQNILMSSLSPEQNTFYSNGKIERKFTLEGGAVVSFDVGDAKQFKLTKSSIDYGFTLGLLLDGENDFPKEANIKSCMVFFMDRAKDQNGIEYVLKAGDPLKLNSPKKLKVLGSFYNQKNETLSMDFETNENNKIRAIRCLPKKIHEAMQLTVGDLAKALGMKLAAVDNKGNSQYRRTGEEEFLMENSSPNSTEPGMKAHGI